jgi:G3E family GTPase
MCCAQAGLLLPAIAQLIRQTKPDRLLIEPSGLGHPGGKLSVVCKCWPASRPVSLLGGTA